MTGDFFIHETSVIDDDVRIGNDTKIWHFSHILSHTSIGERCSFGQNCVVGPNVKMGSGIKVQNNVSIYAGVICERDVFLGPSMVFTNVLNPRSAVPRRDQYETTLVQQGASIGANATIICGNTIGMYALVGAGSVVTKSVLPYALVVGNPARQIGWVSAYGHRLHFDAEQQAICPESGQQYVLKDGQVQELV